ncbi:hypothetical protein BFJ63_vAg18519 [Fusarium oxysporum f. sp. narcissi]|uniref:Extracellular membrane protein CFEM domain-containing protein n=1 Tax=Fusarium oxysporum f. sp. narcissi TaxID=451672 RepID=A0A4Q2V1W1_FUSOX|nr:hypothetical protein BFJ63_vAg18519 [Fusarium oxysporum f. sp. narcissi]
MLSSLNRSIRPVLLGILICSWAVSTFASPMVSSVAIEKDCAARCAEAYDNCVDRTDTSRWECDGFYKVCLGFNPFGLNGAMITPTTCRP